MDDDLGSAVTHAIGAVLSLAGLVALLACALTRDTTTGQVIAVAIYGVTLVGLYLASALYHAFGAVRLNLNAIQTVSIQQLGHPTMPVRTAVSRAMERWFRLLDHTFVLLLVAGSYTPLSLLATAEGDWWGRFYTVWLAVGVGVAYRLLFFKHFPVASRLMYTAIGAVLAFAMVPVLRAMPMHGLYWFAAGIAFMLLGTVLFVSERLPFNHTMWHLCVLAGTGCHFVIVLRYVLPVA